MEYRHAGDHGDYFEAPSDIWQIVRTLAEARRKREVDPTLSMLRNTLLLAFKGKVSLLTGTRRDIGTEAET